MADPYKVVGGVGYHLQPNGSYVDPATGATLPGSPAITTPTTPTTSALTTTPRRSTSWIPPNQRTNPITVPWSPPKTATKLPVATYKPGTTTGTPTITPKSGNVTDYMNPYLDSVLKSGLADLDKSAAARRSAIGGEAFASGAFGDARHGIESAELTDDLLRARGDLTNQVKSQGFNSAMGFLDKDTDRQLQTMLANAGLEGQWFDRNLAALGQQHGFDQDAITNYQSFIDALMGYDQSDRDYTQQQNNLDYEDWLGEQGWDENRLNTVLSMLGLIPGQVGSSSTGSTSTPNNSAFNGIGAALAALFSGSGKNASLFGSGTGGGGSH